jgi:putative transcriptional regulator
MVLHGNEMVQDSQVLPGLFFTTEKSKIEAVMRQGAQQTRYFVGYAGWSPGQLEAELEVESWAILPATDYHVFSSNESLWDKLMTQRMLGRELEMDQIPDDPSVN